VRGVYLGPQVVWMESTVAIEDSAGQAILPAEDLSTTGLFAPGIQGEIDTRDDDYWPTSGSLVKLKGLFFTDALGGSRTFQRYQGTWSWYVRLHGKRLALATNLNLCGVAGDTPFYGLCSIGTGRFGLRGYTQGRYRDEIMTTVQAELRFHTAGRFGAAAFGGFGQVAPGMGEILDAELLPAGGAGLRFQLTRNYPMHLRADYAWGKDGGLLYFSVSEAF
jgi:outer membrane protein assembly factor BamA